MSFQAAVVEVMIASPADVDEERRIVREILAEWNDIHARTRNCVMLPLGWETHSSPELGKSPQDLINERIVLRADLLIGIFWTRVGSRTANSESGTLEEIRKHIERQKPAMLYFSAKPVAPEMLDPDQYASLKQFKFWAFSNGLVSEYVSVDDFKGQLRRQIQTALNDNPYLSNLSTSSSNQSSTDVDLMSEAELRLLQLAAGDGGEEGGHILISEVIGGTYIQVGRHDISTGTHRETAKWRSAVAGLLKRGMLRDSSRDGTVFELTNSAYAFLDNAK